MLTSKDPDKLLGHVKRLLKENPERLNLYSKTGTVSALILQASPYFGVQVDRYSTSPEVTAADLLGIEWKFARFLLLPHFWPLKYRTEYESAAFDPEAQARVVINVINLFLRHYKEYKQQRAAHWKAALNLIGGSPQDLQHFVKQSNL